MISATSALTKACVVSSSSAASSSSISSSSGGNGYHRNAVYGQLGVEDKDFNEAPETEELSEPDTPKKSLINYSCVHIDTREEDSSKSLASETRDFYNSSNAAALHLITVIWDDLPAWRRDNHYIRSGYRRETFSFWGCVRSLSYFHNESINIYSHLLGSLFFLSFIGVTLHMYLPKYPSTSSLDFLVFMAFFVGAVLCLGMSSTYHCINCHSESVAKFGNRLDYLGIIFLIVGSFIPSIYYGLYSIPQYMPVFFGLVLGLGTLCTIVTLRKEFATPTWRPFRALMFVIFGLSGIIPITFAGSRLGYHELSERIGLPFLIAEGALYIAGAAIYAARVPERFKPGAFDLIGSSHQIFHFFVLAAAISHLRGIIIGYENTHGVYGANMI
ncbi:hemolysin-III related-domain-containing protein [Dipodascopsis uninucleata]